ncbi:MAG TPA: YihY/virulence factor BrkB family protein [Oscillospiraceae bacterium]|nr:YihY/virulence factor BrkB family protein [Oscillospiraceae bacterium]
MDRKRAAETLRELAALYFTKRVSRSAAQLAYFLTLSFFPMLICVNALVGLLPVSAREYLSVLAEIVPAESLDAIVDYVNYVAANRSMPLLIGGLILLFSSSSAAFRALNSAVDDLYGRKRHQGVLGLALSFVYSLAMLLIIYGMIIILVTGNWFVSLLREHFELPVFLEHWHWVRFLVLFGGLLALIYVFYHASAPRGRTVFPVFRGAAAVSAALVLVSILFSWFITLSSRYRLVYGSLAAVIVLMVWLYLCGNILIMGAAYNSTRAGRPRKGKKRENPSGG